MRVSELRAMGRFKRVEVGSSEAISSLQGWSRDEGLCVGTTLTSSVSALCERSGAASVLWRCTLGKPR